jgi:hypothetical protein
MSKPSEESFRKMKQNLMMEIEEGRIPDLDAMIKDYPAHLLVIKTLLAGVTDPAWQSEATAIPSDRKNVPVDASALAPKNDKILGDDPFATVDFSDMSLDTP